MVVKIVTDSMADLPPALARELDITVVPLYVHFGYQVYRDRVDISEDEFYQRLQNDEVIPVTTPPTPQDFAETYRKLSREADGIISLHISNKLSATVNAALRGRDLVEHGCPVEILDSELVTMGLGLLAVTACRMADTKLVQNEADPLAQYLDLELVDVLDKCRKVQGIAS